MHHFWMLNDAELYAGSHATQYSTLIFMNYFKCKMTSEVTDNKRNTESFF
jgi:hypothetical protein